MKKICIILCLLSAGMNEIFARNLHKRDTEISQILSGTAADPSKEFEDYMESTTVDSQDLTRIPREQSAEISHISGETLAEQIKRNRSKNNKKTVSHAIFYARRNCRCLINNRCARRDSC